MWNRAIRKINWTVELFTAFCFLMMVLLVFFQIASRAVLGNSYAWTGELSRYLMIWVTFLGASFAFQYGAHISIDIFVNKLPKVIAKVIFIITTLIMIAFLGLLFIEGLNFMSLGKNQLASALQIPMSYVYIIIPISSCLMFLNLMDVSVKKMFSQWNRDL